MMTEAQDAAYGDGLDQSTAHPYMWLLKPHYYGSHVLQLAVHLRAAVRARPVRPVPGRSRTLPRRLRRPALARRHGHRRAARPGVRPRRHRRGVLDRQPRRRAHPHRRLRRTGRSLVDRTRIGRLIGVMAAAAPPTRYGLTRDEFAAVLDGEPRYRLDQVWDGLYDAAGRPVGHHEPAQGAARTPRRRSAARSSRSPNRSATAATPSSSSGNSTGAVGSRPC